jgi:hypothetical protein
MSYIYARKNNILYDIFNNIYVTHNHSVMDPQSYSNGSTIILIIHSYIKLLIELYAVILIF